MNITSTKWTSASGWQPGLDTMPQKAGLVLYFGATDIITTANGPVQELIKRYAPAVVAGCSTAGEIYGMVVEEGSLAVVCIEFDRTRVRAEALTITSPTDSNEKGKKLGRRLIAEDLRHVIVLADGLAVDGAALALGLSGMLPSRTKATGGLAGDGTRFVKPVVGLGEMIGSQLLVGIGLYGEHLQSTFQHTGGWLPFGPYLEITEADGNILKQIGDEPALEVYKRYLGERACDLPTSGLNFPLQLSPSMDSDDGVIRSILGVDVENQSLLLAGTVQKGHFVRISRAQPDDLIGRTYNSALATPPPEKDWRRLALLVSCVGRKLVLGERVDEEVAAVRSRMGPDVCTVGFYSYGEIGPVNARVRCALHNQTMTVSLLYESAQPA